MNPSALRVALADDQALIRAGLRALLERQAITVALEAADGNELIDKLADESVDVVLSDIRMPC
ncbi:MAG: response regulator transcription factor, partial [Pseudomonas fluorescens]